MQEINVASYSKRGSADKMTCYNVERIILNAWKFKGNGKYKLYFNVTHQNIAMQYLD